MNKYNLFPQIMEQRINSGVKTQVDFCALLFLTTVNSLSIIWLIVPPRCHHTRHNILFPWIILTAYNCFIIRSPRMNIFERRNNLPFSRKSNRKKEKSEVSFRAEYYLQPNPIRPHCPWEDHYLKAITCRSSDGFSANEKKEYLHGMII